MGRGDRPARRIAAEKPRRRRIELAKAYAAGARASGARLAALLVVLEQSLSFIAGSGGHALIADPTLRSTVRRALLDVRTGHKWWDETRSAPVPLTTMRTPFSRMTQDEAYAEGLDDDQRRTDDRLSLLDAGIALIEREVIPAMVRDQREALGEFLWRLRRDARVAAGKHRPGPADDGP